MMMAAIDPAWSDFYTAGGFVAGVLSLFVGIAGFWYTIKQVWKTKAAAQAAEEAANRTLRESGRKFREFVTANAHRHLLEANQQIFEGQWAMAGLRAFDLADDLAQLVSDDTEFKELVASVRAMALAMTEKSKKVTKRFSVKQWNEVLQRLRPKIDLLQRLFADSRGVNT